MKTLRENHGDHVRRNARLGLKLFAAYVALYGGFILLATFRPALFAAEAPGGVNWAIAYGLGLIFAAFLLALVYMMLCGDPQSAAGTDEGVEG